MGGNGRKQKHGDGIIGNFNLKPLKTLLIYCRHELEGQRASLKLQLLGTYHREIAKYVGLFPPGTTMVQMVRYYQFRILIHSIMFGTVFGIIVFVLLTTQVQPVGAAWFVVVLAAGSVGVWSHMAIVYWTRVPRALQLSTRPEFASDLTSRWDPSSHASVPLLENSQRSYQTQTI